MRLFSVLSNMKPTDCYKMHETTATTTTTTTTAATATATATTTASAAAAAHIDNIKARSAAS